MGSIFQWIYLNPISFRAFLTSFVAGLVKAYLQISGKEAHLSQWNDGIPTLIDVIIGAIAFIGVIMGAVHATRGPNLTSVAQAATIAASIKGPPVSPIVDEIKILAEAVVAIPVNPDTNDKPHLI